MYDYKDMFVVSNLPDPLYCDEFKDLMKQVKMGNMSARDKIALHNIKLVINIVLSRFRKTEYEVSELISVGLIGLINAIDRFDEEKYSVFSAYAGKCIENEIRLFIRKKHVYEESLEDDIFIHADGGSFKRYDSISSEMNDVIMDYERKEIISVVRKMVDNLSGRDREIVKLYFGFYDDRQYSQNEIAIMMGMTRSNVSRIMQYSLRVLGDQLKGYDIISGEFNIRNWIYNSKTKNGNDIDDISRLNTVYGYFHNYSCQEIDNVLIMLTDEERRLLSLKYGSNLDSVVNGEKMRMDYVDLIYGVIIPKIRNLLESGRVKRLKREKIC